jgi:hypothetical protein
MPDRVTFGLLTRLTQVEHQTCSGISAQVQISGSQ